MLATLLFLVLAFGLLVMVPLMLVSAILKVAVGLVLLPLRLLGGALHLVFGLVGGVFKLLFGAAGLLALVVGGFVLLVALPLLPLLFLGAVVWAILRLFRSTSSTRVTV